MDVLNLSPRCLGVEALQLSLQVLKSLLLA